METNRKIVYSGTSLVQAMGFKNALSEEGIDFYEIDKSDSAYAGLFDEVRISVNSKDESAALTVLRRLNY